MVQYVYCAKCQIRVYPAEPQATEGGEIIHRDCQKARKDRHERILELLKRLDPPHVKQPP